MKAAKIFASVAIAGGLSAGAVGLGTGIADATPGIAPVPADWGPQVPGGPHHHDRGRGQNRGWNGPQDWAPPAAPPVFDGAGLDAGAPLGVAPLGVAPLGGAPLGGAPLGGLLNTGLCLIGFCLTAP
jgi:hypothetical protein